MTRKLNKKLIIGIVLAAIAFVPVIIGLFYTPYDPNFMDASAMTEAPSLAHIFGTDNFGRDVFSRIVSGGAMTFLVSILVILFAGAVGTAIGAITGYYGGIIDEILMRINDALASIPSILLSLVVVSVLGVGTVNVIIAMTLVFIPTFARIVRGEMIKERGKDYVKNALLAGAGTFRVIFRHILPNTFSIIVSTALIGINNAILAEAGMSFLGLGVQPPDPSLGRMLSESQSFLFSSPWYALFTGAYIVIAISSITLIGENMEGIGDTYKKVKRRINKARIPSDTKGFEAGSDCEAGNGAETVLSIKNLSVGFIDELGEISKCLDDISLELKDKEILGIVGESGAGKSMLAKTVIGIIPETSCILQGSITYYSKKNGEKGGIRLDKLNNEQLSQLRGREISMVFQEPMTSLNPLLTIGEQVKEVLDIHFPQLSEEEKRKRTLEALRECELQGEDVYDLYPHELSGGMRQRAVIAMAIIAHPEIIIADEPTTALDAEIQDKILALLKKLSNKYELSVVLISHDLQVVSSICDRVIVCKDGKKVEEGSTESVFFSPKEEYTKKLILAAKGTVYADKTKNDREDKVLELRHLNVYYKQRQHGFFSKSTLRKTVSDACMEVYRGDIIGLVGKSGSGKTTLVKAIVGFQKYFDGEVIYDKDKTFSMVFQDPHTSLNPAARVGWILEEPLRCAGVLKSERKKRVNELLCKVELDETYAQRHISELSGGQKQRVAIAYAMILKHDIIILDEPVSALDVTIREQILDLLLKLKDEYKLSYVFITHDPALVNRFCNRVYKVTDGCVCEVV